MINLYLYRHVQVFKGINIHLNILNDSPEGEDVIVPGGRLHVEDGPSHALHIEQRVKEHPLHLLALGLELVSPSAAETRLVNHLKLIDPRNNRVLPLKQQQSKKVVLKGVVGISIFVTIENQNLKITTYLTFQK